MINLNPRKPLIKFLLLAAVYSLLITIIGCEAFVRKFTRKQKKDNIPQEEMVLAPEEWKGPQMTKEQMYRQYFMFWKSWQDELIESLLQKRSQKKQIDCSSEAIKNLIGLRGLLNSDSQKKLDNYIGQTKGLRDSISRDSYGSSSLGFANTAERIRRNILKDFSYNKVKNYLL